MHVRKVMLFSFYGKNLFETKEIRRRNTWDEAVRNPVFDVHVLCQKGHEQVIGLGRETNLTSCILKGPTIHLELSVSYLEMSFFDFFVPFPAFSS